MTPGQHAVERADVRRFERERDEIRRASGLSSRSSICSDTKGVHATASADALVPLGAGRAAISFWFTPD